MRLAHGWVLTPAQEMPDQLIAGFIRPAVRAMPATMAARLGACRITLLAQFEDPAQTSQWTQDEATLEVSAATTGIEEHDIAMEVLTCLGQVLWEQLRHDERVSYWRLLDAEVQAGIAGEIDEAALEAKRAMLAGIEQARRSDLLKRYGQASFAATTAEYVHSLWHDVSVRTGREHLPALRLRRRLELLARWFPPGRGYALFATPPRK